MFHSLEEFDEGKRSCRKRLDGHNRRRRKPQAEPLSMNSARFFPSHQGNEYMNFRVPQLFPPSPAGSLSWGGAMKPENESVFFNIHPQSSFHRRQGGSFSGQSPPRKQFPIMEGGDGSADGSMCHQPMLTQKPSGNSQKMCPDELNQVVNTSRALSLLSSSPCQEAGQSCCIEGQQGLHLPSHHHSLMLHYGDSSGLSSYPCPLQHRTPSSLMLDDAADAARLLHCQEAGMFQTRQDDPPDNCPTHHTLSFSWD